MVIQRMDPSILPNIECSFLLILQELWFRIWQSRMRVFFYAIVRE